MEQQQKWQRVKRLSLLLLLAFVLVFLLRWAYELVFSGKDIVIRYDSGNISSEYYDKSGQSNIASSKIRQMDSAGHEIMIDQKYEKTANIASLAKNFASANETLRGIIQEHDAVIQLEKLSGLEGSQRLEMAIGIIPDRFDSLVESVREVGELRSFSVNKVDRTAEYRNLMAEIETLNRTKESYNALKERGGNIQDSLLLEEKILEVEHSLQSLGVDMGLFATENSFCTVNFTLQEIAGGNLSVRFALTCAKRSALWTLGTFAIVLFLLLAALCCVYFFVSLTGRIRKGPQPSAPSSGGGPSLPEDSSGPDEGTNA